MSNFKFGVPDCFSDADFDAERDKNHQDSKYDVTRTCLGSVSKDNIMGKMRIAVKSSLVFTNDITASYTASIIDQKVSSFLMEHQPQGYWSSAFCLCYGSNWVRADGLGNIWKFSLYGRR